MLPIHMSGGWVSPTRLSCLPSFLRRLHSKEVTPLSTAIVEQLKAQLKQLEAERREHEKAAAKIRAQEVKVRKALASVASLVPPSSN